MWLILKRLSICLFVLCFVAQIEEAHAAQYSFTLHNICGPNITALDFSLVDPATGITDFGDPPEWVGVLIDGKGIAWATAGAGIPEGGQAGPFSFTIDAENVTFKWAVKRGQHGWGPYHTEEWECHKAQECNFDLEECYIPDTPTLTEWGLIIFALLLVATAIWVLRRKKRFASLAG